MQRVGVAGIGTIGSRVTLALARGIDGLRLEVVAGRDPQSLCTRLGDLGVVADVASLGELARRCDIVVDCTPKEAFLDVAVPTLTAGRTLVTVSGAALLEHPDITDVARANGARIVLVTGGLLGLDAVRAAAEGSISSVTIVTRKPPKSLSGAPHLVRQGIDLEALSGPTLVFSGSAREGARGFPANVNVAAALSLAGIGPDLTRLEIWADPALERNTHAIKVVADSATFEMSVQSVPISESPGVGRLTPLSVIAALRGLVATLRVGS